MSNEKKYPFLLIDLGSKIKQLRLNKGLTQSALSMICDMEKASVSRIEAGLINVSFTTLCRLSEGLETPVKDFF